MLIVNKLHFLYYNIWGKTVLLVITKIFCRNVKTAAGLQIFLLFIGDFYLFVYPSVVN